jgi:hypothetical protein
MRKHETSRSRSPTEEINPFTGRPRSPSPYVNRRNSVNSNERPPTRRHSYDGRGSERHQSGNQPRVTEQCQHCGKQHNGLCQFLDMNHPNVNRHGR